MSDIGRIIKVPTLGDIPADLPQPLRDLLEALVQTIDIREGRVAKATNTRFVTIGDLVGAGIVLDSGGAAVSFISGTLAADVALNNTANYFDGPSVPQGSAGTWFASGTVSLNDTGGAADLHLKLWDGTTVIASTRIRVDGAGFWRTASLSGVLASPAGNLRISVRDTTLTTGVILANATGNGKDSTITAFRIPNGVIT